jgi:hypothetical protein
VVSVHELKRLSPGGAKGWAFVGSWASGGACVRFGSKVRQKIRRRGGTTVAVATLDQVLIGSRPARALDVTARVIGIGSWHLPVFREGGPRVGPETETARGPAPDAAR